MKKRWLYNPIEQCDLHGADVHILTDCVQSGDSQIECFDSDECRCSEGCKGWMTADEDSFYCNWIDDEDKAKDDAVEAKVRQELVKYGITEHVKLCKSSSQRGRTVSVKCKCGTTFQARVADRKRGWGKFCSKSCKAIYSKQPGNRRMR